MRKYSIGLKKYMTHAENPTYGFMKSLYIIAATVRAVGV
jgi:hypothetical protein